MRTCKCLIKWPRKTTSYGTDSPSLIKLIKLVAQTISPFGHSSDSKLGNFPSSQQQRQLEVKVSGREQPQRHSVHKPVGLIFHKKKKMFYLMTCPEGKLMMTF